eukprot:scaffold3882_cov164-Amphora_coffeaeformis.AAC.6
MPANQYAMTILFAEKLRGQDVHDGDRAGDGLPGEKRSHGDHCCTSVLDFNVLETSVLFSGNLLLDAKVVKVQVTGYLLGGLSSEVVSRMTDGFTLGNHDESKDSTKDTGVFGGENTQGLGPVGFDRGAREVQAKAKSVLMYR